MPNDNDRNRPARHGRRAAYSVVAVARLCGLSRSRFYELIDGGVMPPPVYDLRTRRPFYPSELAAACVEVRETSTGFDGRFVMFYERRAISTPHPLPPTASVSRRRHQPVTDEITREMIEALRSMGITVAEAEVVEAVRRQCPQGLTEDGFERDLLVLYGDLRRPGGGGNPSAQRPGTAG